VCGMAVSVQIVWYDGECPYLFVMAVSVKIVWSVGECSDFVV
jgi:hypothetical protein